MGKKATPSSFGARITKERLRRGWSLRQLAAEAALPLSRIHRIESDPFRRVSMEDAVRLAQAFGIPIAWLIQGPQVRDRVLAAARSKDKDHAEEAVDVVIPVLELAAQLDDLEIEADSRPVIRMRPRGSATPSTWGLIAAKALRKEWGVSS